MRCDDFPLFLERWIVDRLFEQEAIELRFRKRVDALLLDRVLRRDHCETIAELVAFTVDRNLALLHRLEQRGLRFGRSAVDLVG